LCVGFATSLLTGLERQRFRELDCDAAKETVYLVDPADVAVANEACHIEGIARPEAWDAETGGYVLARVGTTIVGMTGKCRSSTGNVNHLSLRDSVAKVLCEPDGPMITQPALFSSLSGFVHIYSSEIAYFLSSIYRQICECT